MAERDSADAAYVGWASVLKPEAHSTPVRVEPL